MCLFKLELKRILKTRMTLLLLALSFCLTLLMAYLPTTFHAYEWTDESGVKTHIAGMELYRYQKESGKRFAGAVTPEKVQEALYEYQTCLQEYGVESDYDLPDDVYFERIIPVSGILHGIREVFADPDTGLGADPKDITPESVSEYYDRLTVRLDSVMDLEQSRHPAAKEKAEAIFSRVERPFTFIPGYTNETVDYQILLALLVVVFCTILASPVFSLDYQTGADDILRCTQHGRQRLATVKVLSALCISSVLFLLSSTLYILFSNTLFGWEYTKTSLQMLYSITTLGAMNLGELQWLQLALGTSSLIATISLILLISSRVRSSAACMALSLFACFAPNLLSGIAGGNLASWVLYALPSAAFGLQTNVAYSVIGFEFLHLGNLSFRPTEVMLFFSLVEIPAFLFFTIRGYCRGRIAQ